MILIGFYYNREEHVQISLNLLILILNSQYNQLIKYNRPGVKLLDKNVLELQQVNLYILIIIIDMIERHHCIAARTN